MTELRADNVGELKAEELAQVVRGECEQPVGGDAQTLQSGVSDVLVAEATCPPPAGATGYQELPTDGPTRVAITPAAADLVTRLVARHGPVMFHQSGGCCDGSSPMCYPVGDLLLGDADVHLGDLAIPGRDPVGVWISRAQYGAWQHTRLTIDVVPGRGAGFSLEAPEGLRFLTRSRLFTAEEREALDVP